VSQNQSRINHTAGQESFE
jgi:hypothetical protein